MEINQYLVKLIEASKGMESLDLFMGKATLNKTEFRLLQEVITRREMQQNIISSELAKKLGITRSAVSQIVTKLEGKNLVKRTPSDYDRKIAYICLSDYAASMFEQHCERANALMEKVVERFGKKKLDKFIADYDELREIFRSVIEENKPE